MGRPVPPNRSRAQLSSRAARRIGGAHRANDARGERDRAALSAVESRSADGWHPLPRFWKTLGECALREWVRHELWRKLSAENAEAWKNLVPVSEDVRLHLLHLIGAHHGELEFGSPVAPKTPEAMALHYIDNLDARLEMFAAGYTTAKPLAARIFDRVRPLPGNLVKSLDKFSPKPPSKDGTLL